MHLFHAIKKRLRFKYRYIERHYSKRSAESMFLRLYSDMS